MIETLASIESRQMIIGKNPLAKINCDFYDKGIDALIEPQVNLLYQETLMMKHFHIMVMKSGLFLHIKFTKLNLK